MTHWEEKRQLYPRVKDFFNGKSIFITGASGFLGTMILESLLKSCPGVHHIYILLRGKKGFSAKQRLEEILKKKVFTKLREDNPEVFRKIRMAEGDISLPQLGLSEQDSLDIINEVTIVFHCASNTFFLKPLKYLLQNNVEGTQHVIEFLKRMRKVEAFVYSSTAYSNSNRRSEIEEIVYRLPYPAQRFLNELKTGDDNSIAELCSHCQPPWPNNYCFSKCIAENLILEQASEFPTAIIRPSLIACSWKGSVPGYCEENSSMAQICIAVGKGFYKVAYLKKNAMFDAIPVDVVVNAHILSVWHLNTERSPSPLVVNCTSFGYYRLILRELMESTAKLILDHPIPMMMRSNPYCIITNNFFWSQVLRFIEHYIPAYAIDLLLILQGRKPKLVLLYRFLDRIEETGNYFVNNKWNYEVKNFRGLEKPLCKEDKEEFYIDATGLRGVTLIESCVTGFPSYDWSIDKKSKKERMKIAKRVYMFSRFSQVMSATFVVWLLYQLYSLVAS